MPAKPKSKSKKSVTHTVKKSAPSRVKHIEAPAVIEEPQTPPVADVVQAPSPLPSVEPVTPAVSVSPPPAKQDQAPRDIPTSEPVENLEQILVNDKTESEASGKNQVIFSIGVVVTIGLIAASLFVFAIYLRSVKTVQPVPRTTLNSPTQTPTPAFSRASITFEVINASGVAGAAGKGKDALTQYGYTVLATGNGKKQATTQLFLAKNLSKEAIAAIINDVNAVFSVSSSSGDLVGSTASARIILGSK